MLFPPRPPPGTTGIELVREHDGFPVVLAVGLLGDDDSALPLLPHGPGLPLLGEHARGRFTRPHLRGRRAGGTAWSTRFTCLDLAADDPIGDYLTALALFETVFGNLARLM